MNLYIFQWYTMTSYFNIIINIVIITDPTFSSVNKFFVRIFFITSLQYSISWMAYTNYASSQNDPKTTPNDPKQAKTSQKET